MTSEEPLKEPVRLMLQIVGIVVDDRFEGMTGLTLDYPSPKTETVDQGKEAMTRAKAMMPEELKKSMPKDMVTYLEYVGTLLQESSAPRGPPAYTHKHSYLLLPTYLARNFRIGDFIELPIHVMKETVL